MTKKSRRGNKLGSNNLTEEDLDWENYQKLLKEENEKLASNSIKPRKTKDIPYNEQLGNSVYICTCPIHRFSYQTSIYPSCPICKADKITKDNPGWIKKRRGKKSITN